MMYVTNQNEKNSTVYKAGITKYIIYATNVHRGGSCSQDIYDFFSKAEPGSLDPVSR